MKTKLFIFIGFILIGMAFIIPVNNPIIETPADIGKELFFDTQLSKDHSISCASCHQPQFAFADNQAFSTGVGGKKGARNTPSVMNMLFRPYFFYDGRAATLEEQILFPIEDQLEMHLDYSIAVERVQQDSNYIQYFEQVYESKPDSALVLHAIAEFIRSLESGGSAPHDQWINDFNPNALNDAQLRGREIFLEKGKCFDCHFGPDFTGDEFKNIGLYNGENLNDAGRFLITNDSTDLGKFKVPTLRNITLTAPYMHNGMFATLEEVVAFYNDPKSIISNSINIDTLLQQPLNLTEQEQADLVQFLHSLTDETIPYNF